MGIDFFNDAQNKVNFQDQVTIGEGQRNDMVSQLLRSIGSLQSQTLNRSQDTAGRFGLPAATQLAQERGIGLNSARQAQEGTAGIDQFVSQQNIAGLQFLLDMAFKQKALNAQGEFDVNALFGALGQAGGAGLGFALGGPPGAVAGAAAGGAVTGGGG